MRTFLLRAAVAVVVAAVFAVPSGCGVPVPAPDASTRAAFAAVMAQPAALGEAEALVTRDCLRAHGFAAPLPRALGGSAPNLPAPLGRVERDGYGGVVDRDGGGDDVLARFAAGLPAAERERFAAALVDPTAPTVRYVTPRDWAVAAPTGGCVAAARTAVYGSVRAWLATTALPQDLNAEAAQVYDDPRTAGPQGRYRSCMAGRGVAARFPQDAVALVQRALVPGAPEVGRYEREVATADAACRMEADLLPVYLDVVADLGGEWLVGNAGVVRETGNVVAGATGRADAILADRQNA